MNYDLAVLERMSLIVRNTGGIQPTQLQSDNFERQHLAYWRSLVDVTGGGPVTPSATNYRQELLRLMARLIVNLGGIVPVTPQAANFELVHVLYLEALLALAPFVVLHPDATAYQLELAANGGTISSTQLLALSNAAASIQSAGLRAKVLHLSPMTGINLQSARTKFYKDPTESLFTNTFVGYNTADYTAIAGLTGGAGRYVDSGFFPSVSGMRDNATDGFYSMGMGCFISNNVAAVGGSNIDMGCEGVSYSAGLQSTLERHLLFIGSTIIADTFGTGKRNTDATQRTGWIYSTCYNAPGPLAAWDLYAAGTRIAAQTVGVFGGELNPSAVLHFQNFNQPAGGIAPLFPSGNTGRLYTLTLGMNQTEASAFGAIMQTLGTALAAG
jgi:hypothetical protein